MKNLTPFENYKNQKPSAPHQINEASTSSIMSDCYKKVLGEEQDPEEKSAAHEIMMALLDEKSRMSDLIGASSQEKKIVKALEGIKTQDQFKKTFELLQCMITTQAQSANSGLPIPNWLKSKKNFLATAKETLDWLDSYLFTSFGVLPDYGESEMRMSFKKATDRFKL